VTVECLVQVCHAPPICHNYTRYSLSIPSVSTGHQPEAAIAPLRIEHNARPAHTLCTCIHTRNHCVNTVLHCTNLQPPAPALPHTVKFEVCRWQVSCPNSTAGRGGRCSEGSSSLLTAWAPAGAAVCAC
jgi:hypothetical protein